MSNELAVLEGGLPSYLKGLDIDATTKALMGSGGGESKRISIRGGVWRMIVNGKEVAKNEDRAMNVVIVAAADKVSRTFYAKQYSEGGEVTAPDCWSANGDFPDQRVTTPQAKRCMDCRQNEKGSGMGDSRACRYSQRLAVVLASDLEGAVMQLTLPAASIFGSGEPGKWPLQTYARMIGGKGVPITAVVTEMRFDTDSATPRLTFKPIRVLTPEEHSIVIEQGKSQAATRAITMTVAETDGAKAAPALAAASKEEPLEETTPVKRAAKKEGPQVEKKDLAAILDAWDD